ncbi:helix-turn-helix transcriptional regulator [Nocardia sp. 2]|uniref:Helix-turn-helix transcriptional regulator n=1 Tax=Nocardia acididurans TaxID=2802282 RepID=A0ABS1LXB3_9NOCA|nr:helix-turn-helix transcriptional regulator [Nocardia acididurans]MBL1072967.1 helix-turn-helix transcriptional regulator [Nocardia acididurans]
MGMKEMASDIDRAVGAELSAARARRRLTRPQLSELTGLAVSTIQRFENGERSPDMNQLFALCEALEIPMREFVAMAMRNMERPQD